LKLRIRDTRRLLETSTAASKSNKLVADLALLGRPQVVPKKCESSGSPPSVSLTSQTENAEDAPWSVSKAARFLGVSPQTVYLWGERRQIPHLRVMGRNIRFLRDDLERFRATFRRDPAGPQVEMP
jgi:excisionase family DNA binding protein